MIAVAALATGAATSCQQHNTLTAAEEADGWQLLFNGENLDGWRDYNGDSLTNGWRVVDGCIQASGEGGDALGLHRNRQEIRQLRAGMGLEAHPRR